MDDRLSVLLVAFVFLLLVAPAGSPVQVSYVYSDSMEPAIEANAGYLLVPALDVREGDVITFQAEDRDEHVTHRVVEVTAEGYVTKGDANDVTDQSAGRSPVRRSQVVGEVLAIGGHLLVVPHVGLVANVLHEHRWSMIGLAVLAGAVLLGRGRATTSRPRRIVQRQGDLLWPVLLVGVAIAVIVSLLATDTESLTYVAVAGSTDAPMLLTVGEPATRTVFLEGSKPPFTHRFVSAEGMQVVGATANRTTINLTVSHPPPDGIGPHEKSVRVSHYPATLPRSVLARLHGIDPLLAAVGSVGTAAVFVLGIVGLFVDGKKPVRRGGSRSGNGFRGS